MLQLALIRTTVPDYLFMYLRLFLEGTVTECSRCL